MEFASFREAAEHAARNPGRVRLISGKGEAPRFIVEPFQPGGPSVEQRIAALVAEAVDEKLHMVAAELEALRFGEALLLDLVAAANRLLGDLHSVGAVQGLADAVRAAEGKS